MTLHRRAAIFGALLAVTLSVTAARGAELTELSAGDIAAGIKSGSVKSLDVVEALLERAEGKAGLNAFITLGGDTARAEAAKADAQSAADRPTGALHGVPIVVKDNINSADMPTTGGTPGLKDFTPAADAPVLKKLREAGAVLIGKTNLHELAFGITSNNAAFGAVGNAYDPSHFAGGSSGGTAAAVGARLAPAGLGTDTGGSVRIPAALNGIAGLRPTVGRYPQGGIVPISTTRDTAGPMARSVTDLVLLDGVITGSPTVLDPVPAEAIRLGVPKAFNGDLDAETARLMTAAITKMRSAGIEIVETDLPTVMELNGKVGFPVALYEVKIALANYLADHDTGVSLPELAAAVASPDVKFVFDNLVLGDKAIPAAVYRAAIADFRPMLQAAYAETFASQRLDAIVFPTTPLPAQPIAGSDQTVSLNGRDVPTFATFIRHTDPGSNAGLPGLTLPIGLTADGLPVGLELDGPAHTDRRLLAIGLTLETLFGTLPAPR